MIDWIKKNIDPPGIDKKKRGSIFSAIGRIMGRVFSDAKKAFNAHFPYLADEKKLQEHGKALVIPHLLNDRPDDYRNRVTAASFFLMKAGERGFIMDLLKVRFGDRFDVVERFLQLQTKVAELTEAEKKWTFALLDSLIDPAVSLEITNWLRFIEHIPVHDAPAAIMCQHHLYNGRFSYDGSIDYSGESLFEVDLI